MYAVLQNLNSKPTLDGFHMKNLQLSGKRHNHKMIYFRACQAAKLSPSKEALQVSIPLVKMCGITSAKDAAVAIEAGASFIGMIVWPNSKRSVSIQVAQEISRVARDNGVDPVGVFVDEDADQILKASDAANLELVQLHGDGARAAFPIVSQHRSVIYVLHADESGKLLNGISDDESLASPDWVLVDSLCGGSGKGFDWRRFSLPHISTKNGWLLAGGLNPENVSEAVSVLRPDGVDVSSGICGFDGIEKDPSQIFSFMSNIRSMRKQL
ncbi:hypothetical protein AMTRI_Chr10g225940 [Amborella trichopoda]